MKTKPLSDHYYTVIDGPREKPNGTVLVKVLRPHTVRPSDVPRFYVCEIVAGPRTGQTIQVHYDSFEKEVVNDLK